MSGVTGDFGKLGDLRARIGKVGSGAFMAHLREKATATAAELAKQQRAARPNPYLEAWTSKGSGPTPAAGQGGPSEAMRVKETSDGFVVTASGSDAQSLAKTRGGRPGLSSPAGAPSKWSWRRAVAARAQGRPEGPRVDAWTRAIATLAGKLMRRQLER